MAEQPTPRDEPLEKLLDEPQDQPNTASPVPNRRERRGKKAGAAALHGGKSTVPRRSAPAVPSRQYSTRRRSG